MEHREPLLDPTGDDERTADTRLAPRPRSLAGLRVGLLDNSKPNASAVLTAVADEMRRAWGVASSTTYTKGYFGTPVEPGQIRDIRSECDVVVAGIGDWGSCSAASLADGILLERAGIPTVSICTDAFTAPARAMAAVYGFPGFEFAAVPHPIASLSIDQISTLARALMPDLSRILGLS